MDSTIPNNTNINDVIKASLDNMNELMNVVTSAVKGLNSKKMRDYKQVINKILGEDGLVSIIIDRVNELQDKASTISSIQLSYINRVKVVMSDIADIYKSLIDVYSALDDKNILKFIFKVRFNMRLLEYVVSKLPSITDRLSDIQIDLKSFDNLSSTIDRLNDVTARMVIVQNNLSVLKPKKLRRKMFNIVKTLDDMVLNILEQENLTRESILKAKTSIILLEDMVDYFALYMSKIQKVDGKVKQFNKSSKVIIAGIESFKVIVNSINTGLIGLKINQKINNINWTILNDTISNIVKVMGNMILIVPTAILFISLFPIIFLSMKLITWIIPWLLSTTIGSTNLISVKKYLSVKAKLSMIGSLVMDLMWLSLKVILCTPIYTIAAVMAGIMFIANWAILTAIKGILILINSISSRLIFASIGRLTLISLLFLAIGAMIIMFSLQAALVVENWKNILIFLGIMVAYIATMLLIGGLVMLASPILGPSILGLGLVLIATTIFTLIALQLLLVQNLGMDRDKLRENIAAIKNSIFDILSVLFESTYEPKSKPSSLFGSLFNMFGNAFINMSKFILAVPMLAIAIVSVGMITFIAAQLRILQILNLDSDRIKTNVNAVLNTARSILDELFNPVDSKSSNNNEPWYKSVVESGIDWFTGKNFRTLIDSILAVGVLASTFISTTLILVMATELRLLQNLDLNTELIRTNVQKTISLAMSVIDMLFYSHPNTMSIAGDSWWGDCINWASKNIPGFSILRGVGQMIEAILSIGVLALSTISVSLILFMASELRMLQSMNLDAANIQSKVSNVLGTAKSVISSLWDGTYDLPQNNKSFSRKLLEFCLPGPLTQMVDAISTIGMVGPLMISVKMFSVIAEELQKISKYENIGSNKSKLIVSGILTDAQSIINCFDDSKLKFNANVIKKAKLLQEFTGTLAGFTKDINISEHSKLTENTIKLIDKVDKSKLENLKTARNMFKEMKDFSQSISGNFEGLANALNDRIAPLLQELKELIGKIPESVDKSASTISTSMYNTAAWQGGAATTSMMQTQVQTENPTMSKEDVSKIVDQRMMEQTQTVNKGIESRIDEILEALQNYTNPIPVRIS